MGNCPGLRMFSKPDFPLQIIFPRQEVDYITRTTKDIEIFSGQSSFEYKRKKLPRLKSFPKAWNSMIYLKDSDIFTTTIFTFGGSLGEKHECFQPQLFKSFPIISSKLLCPFWIFPQHSGLEISFHSAKITKRMSFINRSRTTVNTETFPSIFLSFLSFILSLVHKNQSIYDRCILFKDILVRRNEVS